jgi:hypothetical protein
MFTYRRSCEEHDEYRVVSLGCVFSISLRLEIIGCPSS